MLIMSSLLIQAQLIYSFKGIYIVYILLIIFQSFSEIFNSLMRDQTDQHSLGEATSSAQSRKEILNKKKTIIKDKSQPLSLQKLGKISNKLSKEERAKIQKQKNRQAAQRSRDQHKEYVTNLQQQIKTLREKVEHSIRYCNRCQQILALQYTAQQNQNLEMIFEDQPPLKLKNEAHHQNETNQQYLEPESFLRWIEPQQELPLMKIMLLVCMIVIGVMIGSNNNKIVSNPRTLVQKYEQSLTQPQNTDMTLISPVQEYEEDLRGLVQLHQGISSEKCLDSLMKVQGPPPRKSLRSIHETIGTEEMSNIMLCSVKTPKGYHLKQDLTDNSVVKLFVSGSDIKKMAEGSQIMMKLTQRNIQLNGIYRVAADIKSVELLQHHSCIL